MSKRNRKGWGSLFFDEIFGTKSKTPLQRREEKRQRENKGDGRRWGRAMNQLNKEHKKNRRYYGYDN